jgi:Icc-related predicted phosphoesterase
MAVKSIRLAALGDTHINHRPVKELADLFARVAQSADVLLLAGDLTDNGLPEEARALARELSNLRIPRLAVLGNHDYEAGKQQEVGDILRKAGVVVLDGDACEVSGIGFAGVKGFIGGFDHRLLTPWGEASIKQLVREALDEALKLESALAKLRTSQRVALMHYAPVRGTVQGEPLEIFPFLGSTRFEEPLNRYAVTAVFHGHAHNGTVEGHTRSNVPVYNVALPLLRRTYPDRPPFYLLEVAVDSPTAPETSIGHA